MRIMGIALSLVAGMVWVSLAAPMQNTEVQAPAYITSFYSSGPSRVTIAKRSGQVLSVLEVPAGVGLSVHLSKGEFTEPNEKSDPTFSGDISIRTRPRNELVIGSSSLSQMLQAPLKLDVQDAVVVVVRQGK